jgi:hypothetical protein
MSLQARERRDRLEQQIAQLRQSKPDLDPDAYFQQLEPLMLELAGLYQGSENQENNQAASGEPVPEQDGKPPEKTGPPAAPEVP